MSKMPTYEEFYGYFEQSMKQKKDDPKIYTEWIEDKYEAWKLNEWKKEKGAKLIPIKNWRSTLRQCLPYRMRNKVKDLTVRAEILKPTGKMAQIENELILSAYNHFSVMKKLELKHEECFKFLYERGIFKDPEEISERTGKPWSEWYDSLAQKAFYRALDYAKAHKWKAEDIRRLRTGQDPILKRYGSILALETYFKRFENEDQLRRTLG